MLPSNEKLSQVVFHAMPLAAVVVDQQGCILTRNGPAERILPPGGAFRDAIVPGGDPDALDLQTQLQRLGQADGSNVVRGIWLYRRTGKQFLADVYFSLLESHQAAGGPGAGQLLVLVEDVSDRAMIERRLSASQRLAAIGYLSQKVAHELNTPLDGVLRYLGLAERTCEAQTREYLQKARTGLARMAGMIRDLADQGRLGSHFAGSGKLGHLVEEALSSVQSKLQTMDIEVRCDLGPAAECVVDANLFHVICNLLSNALYVMDQGGLLEVTAWLSQQMLLLDVCDSGCGFIADIPEQIFEPFYTTKPAGQGSGLGLAICKELVERMEGQIHASNRAEGGARVTVSIPLKPEGRSDDG
ncbi:MAG: sensor histidine kinase [Phycisphaerae bacterium]